MEMGNAMKIWIGNKENLGYVSKIIAEDWRSIYLELYSQNMVQGNVEIDDLTEEDIKKLISDETADKYNAVLIEKVLGLEQNPKTGRWILTDVERDRIWGCKCSECGKDPQDYIYGSEDWWLTYGNLPKFCPTCGSRNF